MYDIEKKIIFTHFPKTGGTTIEAGFNWHPNLNVEKGAEYVRYFRKFKHAPLTNHVVALESQGFNIKDFFVFTCVRNPWDIMVSRFFHDKYEGAHLHAYESQREQLKYISSLPFDEYVEVRLKSKSFLDIKPFIIHGNANLVNASIRFENYKEDAEKIFKKYGVTWPAMNYNTHSRPKNTFYKSFYNNNKTKKLVEDAAESFIKFFGYTFES